MNMNKCLKWMAVLALLPSLSFAANPRLVLPDFAALAGKATDSVTITLDASMLALAKRPPRTPSKACRVSSSEAIRSIRMRLTSHRTSTACAVNLLLRAGIV